VGSLLEGGEEEEGERGRSEGESGPPLRRQIATRCAKEENHGVGPSLLLKAPPPNFDVSHSVAPNSLTHSARTTPLTQKRTRVSHWLIHSTALSRLVRSLSSAVPPTGT
jgi:hypothetical protein